MRLFILFFFFISYSYSQVESSKRKIELPPPSKKTLIPPVTKQNPNAFTILKNPNNPQKSIMEQDSEFFADPGKKYLKKLKVDENKKNPNEYLGDAYLGDVSTVSKKANIVCRDFEYMDGDRVSILVNDEVVVQNLAVNGHWKTEKHTIQMVQSSFMLMIKKVQYLKKCWSKLTILIWHTSLEVNL